MKIVVGRECRLSAPVMFSASRFVPGQEVWRAGHVDWPGKPHPRGPHPKWSFWTDYDIDGALIFSAEDVKTLRIPDTPQHRAYFEGAPLDGAPFGVEWVAGGWR